MQRDDPSVGPDLDDRRYEVERKLGEGGAGSVYLVRDRETGERLALKRLHRIDDRSVARLKREFRSLANLNHRNVIKLYDLGRSRDAWFLTMEFLDGVELLHYLDSEPSISQTMAGGKRDLQLAAAGQVRRVAGAFHQLADGVSALHRAGVLHRDLKPSNVIVAQDRVVVVDFGLALEIGEHAATVTLDGLVVGTPAYMAPEQLQGCDWGEPNDWYAFGVMLYEALSGFLPIDGRLQELLRKKLDSDPTPLAELVSDLPPALSQLCMRLLSRQPELRATAAEILATLQACSDQPREAEREPQQPFTTTRQRLSEPWIFGREAEHERLSAALQQVQAGAFAAVHISGVSGVGKSVLVERFLEELSQQPARTRGQRLMILRSRCYEREQVPFKALDPALDALVTQLSREDEVEVSYVLPSELQILTQLFPSLTRLSVVQRLIDPAQAAIGARQALERADAALRELFVRLGSRRTVVLWIDDLHWGDLDSGRILKGWIETRELRGVLLILSYRSDEVATSPCLRLLLNSSALDDTVPLAPLTDEHIRALCQDRFARAEQDQVLLREITEHIVIEAQGSPFLASQLAALALSESSESGPDALEILTIEQLVSRRTALLTVPARKLLHVLAAASRPLPARLALQLAAAAQASRAAVHELAGLGLIRTRNDSGERSLEIYHDRLREAVLTRLTAEERSLLDAELLRALEGEGASDVAWLHALALGARDHAAALRYGLAAAERASQGLAFEFAAELYRTCLGLGVSDARELCSLWHKLARALAHSGHGYQAANAYLEAAQRAEGFEALQFKRQAASHFLRSGRFDAGEALILEVFEALAIELPTSTPGLLAAIAWERTRLAVRGLSFTPRVVDDVPPQRRFAGELCGTLSVETQIYAPLRAALLQARSLRYALDAGFPALIVRALCVAATMAAVSGTTRSDELLQRASELAKPLNSPLLEGNLHAARAVCAFLHSELSQVVEHSDAFERAYRGASSDDEGEYYHRSTVIAARLTALVLLNRQAEAHSELQAALKEARDTENIAALLTLSALRTRAEIAADQWQGALARLEQEYEQLPREQFGLLHVYHIASILRLGCISEDFAWTTRCLRDLYERLQRSLFKRAGTFAVLLPMMHARFLLNRGVREEQPPAALRKLVARDLDALAGFSTPTARAGHLRTRARLAVLAGDRAKAVTLLRASIPLFEGPMTMEELARDRYAYADLTGDEAGKASAIEALRNHGNVNPVRDLVSHFPELFLGK